MMEIWGNTIQTILETPFYLSGTYRTVDYAVEMQRLVQHDKVAPERLL